LEEYHGASSIEAKLAKLADLIATHVQAKRYLELGYKVEDIIEKPRMKY